MNGGYPTANGVTKITTVRVADLNPAQLTFTLSGGSIAVDGTLAIVSTPTIKSSDGILSFWIQAFDEDYTKAVKLVLEDRNNGIFVKATEAKYIQGDQINVDWSTSGTVATVATSLDSNGYGVSFLGAYGSAITEAMRGDGVLGPTYTPGVDSKAQNIISEQINTATGGDRVSVSRHFRGFGFDDPVEGGNSLAFYVYRDNTSSTKTNLTVNFSLTGTATPGVDYTGHIRRASDNVEIDTFTPAATGNTVTLSADVNGVVVELRPTNDTIPEGTETIGFKLTGVSGSQSFYPLGINNSVDVNLLDNDASTIQVGFATNTSLIAEQLDPSGNIRDITVKLNQSSNEPISVRYRSNSGSAQGLGSDWTFVDSSGKAVTEGILTFAPGETSNTIKVRVQADSIPENRETIGIVLDRPTGASLRSGYNTHTVAIYDFPDAFKEERWTGTSVYTNNSWDSWVLVDGGYPDAAGKLKTTALRVADLDPSKLLLWLSGGSVTTKDQLGVVRLDTVLRSNGTLSFWVEGSKESKAVKL